MPNRTPKTPLRSSAEISEGADATKPPFSRTFLARGAASQSSCHCRKSRIRLGFSSKVATAVNYCQASDRPLNNARAITRSLYSLPLHVRGRAWLSRTRRQ